MNKDNKNKQHNMINKKNEQIKRCRWRNIYRRRWWKEIWWKPRI